MCAECDKPASCYILTMRQNTVKDMKYIKQCNKQDDHNKQISQSVSLFVAAKDQTRSKNITNCER